MTIRYTLKPMVFRSNIAGKPYKCKEQLIAALRNSNIDNNGGSAYGVRWHRRTCVKNQLPQNVGINFEKHRKKVRHIKYKSGPNKGKVKSTDVVKEGGWVAYVYILPADIVIQQNARNFKILGYKGDFLKN